MAQLVLQSMPRTSWGASARSPGSWAPTAAGIVVHWNGPPMGAYSEDQVAAIVRGTRDFHVNGNGWADIAYNFSVDRFGRIWEGRGDEVWNAASGDSAANQNLLAVECLCGKGDPFPDAMKRGLAEIAAAYVAAGRTPHCCGHRDVVATECPGDEIMAYVRQLNENMRSGSLLLPDAAPEPQKEMDMPEYLFQATAQTMFAVYATGRVRELTYPELQYLKAKDSTIVVVQSGDPKNDAVMRMRSMLG